MLEMNVAKPKRLPDTRYVAQVRPDCAKSELKASLWSADSRVKSGCMAAMAAAIRVQMFGGTPLLKFCKAQGAVSEHEYFVPTWGLTMHILSTSFLTTSDSRQQRQVFRSITPAQSCHLIRLIE